MSQFRRPIYLPVLPSTKRRIAQTRRSGLALVVSQPDQAQSASRFRYAGAVAVVAAGALLVNGLVLFSILRDQAHLSQPASKVGTPLQP